ncbi:YjbH domain-containing protein [Idiomarina sp. OT37-5b]|uniref:YjbH domain-containing protein n=1 Tax=Idiomarina sp. OT37-5b TaxID=2100422 RepID=UPI000CF941FF|nr:YjbH domain-containing protein [Idiomarina sp. OT37-5b]AVJ55266.1 YjbH domain-containing protein [Idiomarina sp. OT37-5b]
MIKQRVLVSTLSIVTLGLSVCAKGQDLDPVVASQPTQSDVGGVGLLQMPTARMAPVGEFTASYYDNDEYRRMALSMQLFPWLEATIRYNDIRTRLYSSSPGFSGNQTYKDRGVDVKLRLLQESYWLPELSIGLRDLAGTGKFAGEYLVGSKRFGPVDVTLGVGFGYLGNADDFANPFCEISTEFCQRGTGTSGRGGEFEVDDWFSGNAAVFGGLEYQTPWQPLRIKLEYDGNDYHDEPSGTPVLQDSRWNYGVHYRVSDNANLQLSYERGNTLMFGFNLRTNFNTVTQAKNTPPIAAPENPPVVAVNELDFKDIALSVYNQSGFYPRKIDISDNGKVVTLYGYQGMYRKHKMAIDRAAAVLANRLPVTVEEYRFVDDVWDMQLAEVRVDAAKYKRAFYRADFTSRYEDSYKLVEPSRQPATTAYQYQRQLGWPNVGLRPYLEQAFGSPENFYMYQLRLDAYADWVVSDKLLLNGIISGSLLSNYDDFNFLVDNYNTDVPRVRTYVREYATQSDIWLNNLQATYFEQLGDNWFASAYGGYLERMFAGVGSEWLYRKVGAKWAVGVDINYARQRSFESHFGLRDYDVVTGHATAYWQPSFLKGTLLKVAAGRFLAGDKGVQVKFEKQFDSGIIVGAFAARTNLSAEEYGEGSFSKGFYVSIPFDLFQMNHSAGRARVGWTPLTRDGGQMMGRSNRLFPLTDARDRYYTEW